MEDLTNVFSSINKVLKSVDLKDVTAETSTGFEELPDGYYLSELDSFSIGLSKTSNKPMITLKFTVVENGISLDTDDSGKITRFYNEKTANRKINLFYPITDAITVSRFVADMLKFETSDNPGEPILPREAFMTAEVLAESLEVLVGMRVFISVSTTVGRDGNERTWENPITWKRVSELEIG